MEEVIKRYNEYLEEDSTKLYTYRPTNGTEYTYIQYRTNVIVLKTIHRGRSTNAHMNHIPKLDRCRIDRPIPPGSIFEEFYFKYCR